jgi:hypothetical protein
VDYDKTSKQVDVHVLKKTLWGSMQDFWRRAEMVCHSFCFTILFINSMQMQERRVPINPACQISLSGKVSGCTELCV